MTAANMLARPSSINSKTTSMIWLRQPLTIFILLGVMLFAIDRIWNGPPQPLDGAHNIVVTTTQQQTLLDAFRTEAGRNPTPEETRQRLDRWIEEEVLYREALALNLDRKDLIVHRQLTQKMRFLLNESANAPTPTDAQLQIWLDQHMERYGKPTTISFDQVFLGRGQHGAHLQQDAAAIVAKLAAQPDQFIGLGDPFLQGQHVDNISPINLRRDFGAAFATAVESLQKSVWSNPITSGFGLHLVRITDRRDFQPVPLSEVRDRVLTDFQLAQHVTITQQSVDALKKKYRVEFETPAR
jgi:peptidyl-prolyl cis-trans isomerase C